MKSFLSFVNSKLPYESIAIGKFDGMHKAHIKLLEHVSKNGCALSISSVKPPFVTPPKERLQYTNIPFYRLRFESIKSWDSTEFLKLLFIVMPNLKKIVVGYDFFFGKNRMNSVADMKSLLNDIDREYVEIDILESQKYNNTPIHTSIIKELIKYGDMQSANGMLGRFYCISGLIIKGQGIGKKDVYPTINIRNTLYIIPKYGVYATLAIYENSIYRAISFVGNRLSTDNRFCIETYIIDKDLKVKYGHKFRILFVEYIRNNKKFDDISMLKKQIENDILHTKKLLEQYI